MNRPIASNALSLLRWPDLIRLSDRPTDCRIAADVGANVIKIEARDGGEPNEGMPGTHTAGITGKGSLAFAKRLSPYSRDTSLFDH